MKLNMKILYLSSLFFGLLTVASFSDSRPSKIKLSFVGSVREQSIIEEAIKTYNKAAGGNLISLTSSANAETVIVWSHFKGYRSPDGSKPGLITVNSDVIDINNGSYSICDVTSSSCNVVSDGKAEGTVQIEHAEGYDYSCVTLQAIAIALKLEKLDEDSILSPLEQSKVCDLSEGDIKQLRFRL
jgi:hypothetical protein